MIKKQILIIYKFPVLFDILNEIKEILNFKIKSVNDDINEYPIKNVCLIITKEKNDKIYNQISVNDYPINLFRLIDLINIRFLKIKYDQQDKVKIGKYFININSRKMRNHSNSNALSLTEKETEIIIFLSNSDKPKSIQELQTEVWGYKSKLETHTVETHVYRLRKKIHKFFQDDNFIISSKMGYQLK